MKNQYTQSGWKNGSTVRLHLRMSAREEILNAFGGWKLWLTLYALLVIMPILLAFLFGRTATSCSLPWELVIVLAPFGGLIPACFFWNDFIRIPIARTSWWQQANKKVEAYRTILPYANSCPVHRDTPTLNAHMDGMLLGLVATVKACQSQGADRHAAIFRIEQKRLHRALLSSTLMVLPDWRDYYSNEKHLLSFE